MSLTVFDYKEYRLFLLKFFGDKTERRGLKSKAAKYLGCHTTMMSQVLHGQVLLNLEQADKLCQFMSLNEEETHYFLLMVQTERAGTKSLATYFQNQMEQLLNSRQVIKKRIGKVDAVPAADELKYYSSWQPAAIHVALSIPECKDAESISQFLGISVLQVRGILDFLLRSGLAQLNGRKYVLGPKHIHLGADSSHIKSHHQNWRLRTIQSLEGDTKNSFHYSSAVSLAGADVDKIKELLIQSLKSANKIIQQSEEEELYGLNFDFYNLRST